jgi:hypothetical protein
MRRTVACSSAETGRISRPRSSASEWSTKVNSPLPEEASGRIDAGTPPGASRGGVAALLWRPGVRRDIPLARRPTMLSTRRRLSLPGAKQTGAIPGLMRRARAATPESDITATVNVSTRPRGSLRRDPVSSRLRPSRPSFAGYWPHWCGLVSGMVCCHLLAPGAPGRGARSPRRERAYQVHEVECPTSSKRTQA